MAENIVIGIHGLRGSGKTLLMVALGYIDYRNGKKILTNLSGLNFPSELLKPKDIVSLSKSIQNCTILIDEIQNIADSRKSTRIQNIGLSNFFLQSRHRECNVIYTTQFANTIDKRLRQNTDIKIISKNLYMDIDNDGNYDVFEYVIINMKTEEIKTIRIYGQPIFQLYSDIEIIDIYEYNKEKK